MPSRIVSSLALSCGLQMMVSTVVIVLGRYNAINVESLTPPKGENEITITTKLTRNMKGHKICFSI